MGRALFLAPEAPYPVVGGGALRAASLFEYLARSHTIDAIVFRRPDEPEVAFPPGRVNQVLTLELPRRARRALPRVDRFSGFGAQIAAFLEDRPHYHLGVIEHFWCAPYLEQIGPHCRRTVLDLHNIESAWHAARAQVCRSPASLAYSELALDLERRWLPAYSRVLVTSDQDAARVASIAPLAKLSIYPNAIPSLEAPPRGEQDLIVFSGSLEYEPNRSAVRYFAGEIWPGLRRKWPQLIWRLVGRHPEAVRGFLRGVAGVDCTGPVDDTLPHLAAAKVAVVPILYGSGTRLKIIEAWAAATPVVSTTKGAEGLRARHGENILLADDPQAFSNAVSRLLEDGAERRRIGEAGRELYLQAYTWPQAWRTLDGALHWLY